MDQRIEQFLRHVKAFAATRPVAYGAPACAVVGLLAGLAMRPGPQLEPYNAEMAPMRVAQQDYAEPIAWPAGEVPDYVVGTDFLEATQPPPVRMVSYEQDYAPPPAPDVPEYIQATHGPATPPPPADAPQWASERGDILDVSLPEDRRPQAVPTVLADAAAVGMTTR